MMNLNAVETSLNPNAESNQESWSLKSLLNYSQHFFHHSILKPLIISSIPYIINLTAKEKNEITRCIKSLQDLKINALCDNYQQKILKLMSKTEFKDYFQPQDLYKELATDPKTVTTVKNILKILAKVSDVFFEIESFDLTKEDTLIPQLVIKLQILLREIEPIEKEVRTLSHLIVDISEHLNPIITEWNHLVGFASNTKNITKNFINDTYQINQTTLHALISGNFRGIQFISRCIVISPFIIQEFNELLNSGDNIIDFDPLDPLIKDIENRFQKQLINLTKNTDESDLIGQLNYQKDFITAIAIFIGELKNILNKATPLTKTAYLRGYELLTHFHYQLLPQLQNEIERMEEIYGLKPHSCVNLFLKTTEEWLMTTAKKLEELRKLSNTLYYNKNVLSEPLEYLFKPSNIKKEKIKSLISITDIQLQNDKYLKAIQEWRIKRHANYKLKAEYLVTNIYQKNNKFFKILASSFKNNYQNLHELPEKTRQELTDLYFYIQPYLVKRLPDLDVKIVNGIQYKWDVYYMSVQETFSYINEHQLPQTNYFVIDSIKKQSFFINDSKKTIKLSALHPFIYDLNKELHIKLNESELKKLLVFECLKMDSPTPIKLINDFKEQIFLELSHHIEEENFKKNHLENRLELEIENGLPNFLKSDNYQTYFEKLYEDTFKDDVFPKSIESLGNKFENMDLFSRLTVLKLSKDITYFEDIHIIPMLKRMLTPQNFLLLNYKKGEPIEFNFKDTHVTRLYKRLLNSLYKLHRCLSQLEKVNEIGTNYSNNTQAWISFIIANLNRQDEKISKYVIETLGSILDDGLIAINDLLKSYHMLDLHAFNEFVVSKLKPLEKFNFINHFMDSNKKDNSISEESLKSESITTFQIINWITEQSEQLSQTYKLLNHTNDSETQISKDTIKKMTEHFFQEMQLKSNEIQEKNSKWIDNYKNTPLTLEAISQNIQTNKESIHRLLGDALVGIDTIGIIVFEIFQNNHDNIIHKLKQLHQIIQFCILKIAHDFELNHGLKPGQLNNELNICHHIDNMFRTMIKKSSQNFDENKTLSLFIESRALEFLQNDLNNKLENKLQRIAQNETMTIFEDFIHAEAQKFLNSLKNIKEIYIELDPYLNQKNWKNFEIIKNYQGSNQIQTVIMQKFIDSLSPIFHLLKVIDPEIYFSQNKFLELIQTPMNLATACVEIMNLEPKIFEYFSALSNQEEQYIEDIKAHITFINEPSSNPLLFSIIQTGIKDLLERKLQNILKNYTSTFIRHTLNIMLDKIQEDPDTLKRIADFISQKKSNSVIDELNAFIDHYFCQNESENEFLKNIESLSKMEEFLKEEYQNAWNACSSNKKSYKIKAHPLKNKKLNYNTIYLKHIDHNLEYSIKQPNGQIHSAIIPADKLQEMRINLSHLMPEEPLTQKMIANGIENKIKLILNFINNNHHAPKHNSCLEELLSYMSNLNSNQDKQNDTKKLILKPNSAFIFNKDNPTEFLENSIYFKLNNNNLIVQLRHEDKLMTHTIFKQDLDKIGLSCLSGNLSDLENELLLKQKTKEILNILLINLNPNLKPLKSIEQLMFKQGYEFIFKRENPTEFLEHSIYFKLNNNNLIVQLRHEDKLMTHTIFKQDLDKIGLSYLSNNISDLENELFVKEKAKEILNILSLHELISPISKNQLRMKNLVENIQNEVFYPKKISFNKEILKIHALKAQSHIYDILNEMEEYVYSQMIPNQTKILAIQEFKSIISNKKHSTEKRMDQLLEIISLPIYTDILSKSSDCFILRCIKSILSLIFGYKSKEELLTKKLNASLQDCFRNEKKSYIQPFHFFYHSNNEKINFNIVPSV